MSEWRLADLPFFDARHREVADRLKEWVCPVDPLRESEDLRTDSRAIALSLARHGLLDLVMPQADSGRADLRSICIARESLAYRHVLSDTIFAMQGIGSAPIWMHGSAAQRERYLEPIRAGRAIAAFALSEPGTGSDVSSMATAAKRRGDHYVLNGEKAWISNAGIADHYVVVARTGEGPGSRGLSAFMIDAGTPGLTVGQPIELVAPHPLANLTFKDCAIPASQMLGEPGQGFKVAMATFDIFRASVGAAGVGIARRAISETLQRVTARRLFGRLMSEIEGVQTKLADMSVDIELASLAVYQAAWLHDERRIRISRESAIAKLVGSEAAFRVVDNAVQLWGGMGVQRGTVIEQLYREVRPMRIYEGASEIQKIVIARSLLATKGGSPASPRT